MALNEFTRTCPHCGTIRYITAKGLVMGAKLESPIRVCPECGKKVALLTGKEWCQRGFFAKVFYMIPWWAYLIALPAAALIVFLCFLNSVLPEPTMFLLLTLAASLPFLWLFGQLRCNSASFLEKYAGSILRCRKKEYRASLTSAGKVHSDRVVLYFLTKKSKAIIEEHLKKTHDIRYDSGSLFEF